MTGHFGKEDIERIIAEVAKRHRIVIDVADPIFAVATVNELVLKATVQQTLGAMVATLDRFDASIQRAENRAGQILGIQIREAAEQLREAVHLEIVAGVQRAHSRATLGFWTGVVLLCATALCAASFWLGRLSVLR